MKIFALITALLFSVPSFALVCTQGQIGQDNYKTVTVKHNGRVTILDFDLHESSFTTTVSEARNEGSSMAVLNKNVKFSAEGEESLVNVNALLVFSPTKDLVTVALVLDGQVSIAAEELVCR